MPHLKPPRRINQLWKDADEKADKQGLRHTVYSVNGDEYTGEWQKNLKHGRGTYKWKTTGIIYDGDWKLDKRDGFGVLTVPDNGTYKKQYSGGWKNGKKHGYGENWYTDTEYYEGEWYANQRSGWGRMYYEDGQVYEGEWYNDKRCGQGMMRLDNDNRYEGTWKDDKRNGPGKFFYLDTGQLLEGIWVNDIPKCGEMTDFGRNVAPQATRFPIPECELLSPELVIKEAADHFAPEDVI